jgi:Ca2+-binding EF-hand superfamily protein
MLAAAAPPAEETIRVEGHPWAPFVSPMGEAFRSRGSQDDPLARWFNQADRNHDGVLTPEEMQADTDRFFATLDTNHDGQIDPEELVAYESEIAPEIQVNTRWMRSRGQAAPETQASAPRHGGKRRENDEHDGYQVNGLQGAARYALLNIPEPVAAADADFNRVITLAEFRAAAASRFQLLDSSHQGRLTLQGLEGLVPPPPKRGQRVKRDKNAPDPRIGLPLPPGD